MATRQYTLKNDAYRASRGGYARFLNVYCGKCGSHLLLYQKDGPGVLYRLYLDRIAAPDELSALQHDTALRRTPDLVCKTCGAVVGRPYLWEEENRPAFLLNEGSVIKKVGKGIYPPILTKL
jgi:ribosomal protein S27E